MNVKEMTENDLIALYLKLDEIVKHLEKLKKAEEEKNDR